MPLPNRNSQPPSHPLQPSGSLPKPAGNPVKLPGNNNTPLPIKESFLSANRYKVNIPTTKASAPAVKEAAGPKDASIFGGKNELTRGELREELRSTGSWKAESKAGLNLNAVERAKLEKELFPVAAYGADVSKADFARETKKLKKQAFNSKNPGERKKITKEVKFLKKIGGIQ